MRPPGPTLAVLLLLSLGAGACGPPGAVPPASDVASPTPPLAPVPGDPFGGKGWVLVTLDSRTPLAGTTITLGFVGDRLSGFAGCNRYGGPYTATSGGAFAAPALASTAAGCPPTPTGLAEQEQRYLDTLRAVSTYRRAGAQLRLETGDGRALLFAQQE